MQQHAVAIWVDAMHAGVARQVLDLMGSAVAPVAVGGRCAAEVGVLAKHLDCPTFDDLRKMLVEHPGAQVLFAAATEAGDGELLEGPGAQGRVASLEPVEARGAAKATPRSGPAVLLLPSFLRSPGWVKAADPLEAIGPAQSAALLSVNRAGECSLLAMLFDAWQFVVAAAGVPEGIDATLAPLPARPPQTLSQLGGSLTAHARLSDGRGIVLQVSDRGPAWRRELQVIGDKGMLRASDLAYELTDAQGTTIDQYQAAQRHLSYADLVADQWRNVLAGRNVTATAPEAREVVACCQACLLSMRTRTGENPRKLVDLGQV